MRKSTLLPILATSLGLFHAAASANQVMAWAPPYGIGASKTTLNGTYGKYKAKDGLTHIGLQFWLPTNSGGLRYQSGGPSDSATKWFVDWGKANNVKVLLTVYNHDGGWNWNLAKAAFGANHAAFAKALADEMDKHGLDGVDIDLEGNKLPISDGRAQFKVFIDDLSALLKPKGKTLTICTFNDLNSDNMPDESWFPDWVGKADYIHIMGYSEMYENAPNKAQHYSSQQNLGAQFGYQRYQVSMGVFSTNTWGDGSAEKHINECISAPKETASICIWDLQFPGSSWKTETMWALMEKIKKYTPPSAVLRKAGRFEAAGLPKLRMVNGKLEFTTTRVGEASDAAGRIFDLRP